MGQNLRKFNNYLYFTYENEHKYRILLLKLLCELLWLSLKCCCSCYCCCCCCCCCCSSSSSSSCGIINDRFQYGAKKRRRSAPEPLPDPPNVEDEATVVINGQVVTEAALKKIGRNMLLAFGTGLPDRMEKVKSLTSDQRNILKSCQVRLNK